MWLKQNHDASATRTEFGGSERGPDLCRMMTVIVDDEHTVDFAFRLEPAAGAGEAVQTFDNFFKRHFQLEANRDRSQRVINVVNARHAQDHFADDVSAAPHIERRSKVVIVSDTVC